MSTTRRSPVADIYYENWMACYWVSLGSDGGFFFDRYLDARDWALTHALIVRDHCR